MKLIFRLLAFPVALVSFLALTPPACAAAIDENLPDAQSLSQLETRAQQANPRDQCYLYAELVHTMTEMAVKEIVDGDDQQASATLTKVGQYAHLLQLNLARDTKRLKNAEMLLHHTTLRLAQSLHLASGDDRTTAQATLKQLDLVHDQLLDQVFNH